MAKDRTVFVTIYCKIYTDTFSNDLLGKSVTAEQIFEFLLRDAKQCFDGDGSVIPGDSNIWYLGCNEKFGLLRFENSVCIWGDGESSFDNVEDFVTRLYDEGLFTEKQFETLIGKINEGRLIDNMYDIKDYLICKKDGRKWAKTETAKTFRDDMKTNVSTTIHSLECEGFRVYRN